MKHLLSEAAGVRTYVEARELTNPQHQGWTFVRIFTKADFSRQPDAEQTKVEMCLQQHELAHFKDIINNL